MGKTLRKKITTHIKNIQNSVIVTRDCERNKRENEKQNEIKNEVKHSYGTALLIQEIFNVLFTIFNVNGRVNAGIFLE